jgi:hypothetical protein
MRQWGDKATNMTAGGLLFLALLIPGLVLVILVVAIVLPRALRDEKREHEDDKDPPPHAGAGA